MVENHLQKFQERIEAAGLLPGEIIADGVFHRCGVEGKERGKDGVYKFHADSPCSGYFKNHVTGDGGTWTAGSREKMNPEDRALLRERIKRDKEEASRRREQERAETASKAQALYAKAHDCKSHPYLAAKGVDVVPGLRMIGELLLVPRQSIEGGIVSLVRIWPDGSKKNLPGVVYPAGFFPITGTDKTLLICEGISTGISLHMATGCSVICAFEAVNLPGVARVARGKSPEREIIVCADNDGATEGNPGLTHGKEAAQAIGARLAVPELPGKDKVDFNDVHKALGLPQVKEKVDGAQDADPAEQEPPGEDQPENSSKSWTKALEIFPRVPFPWRVFPPTVERSFKQLARSCASSPLSLPGAALAITCGAVGNTVDISPKSSWREPLIIYCGDLRETGDGKTAPLWALAAPLCKRQEAENKRAEKEVQEYERLSKKEQKQSKKPRPARGHFSTGCTLEGLRQDLTNNPTGGQVVIMSELSSFVSSQNQYKGGGDDREAWLCLHDGKPARVVRAGGKTAYISGGRAQVVGGIQPEVYRKAFTSSDGIFLNDGTLFRFLVTHEPPAHFELTGEAWTDENRDVWEGIIERALEWADGQITEDDYEY